MKLATLLAIAQTRNKNQKLYVINAINQDTLLVIAQQKVNQKEDIREDIREDIIKEDIIKEDIKKGKSNAIIAVITFQNYKSLYTDKYGHIARDCPLKEEDEDYYRGPSK